jgi:hypothetical protein
MSNYQTQILALAAIASSSANSSALSELVMPQISSVVQKTYYWAGQSLTATDLIAPIVGKNGAVSIPVIKDGQISSAWLNKDNAFQVSILDTKEQIVKSTLSGIGELISKPFLIKEGMDSLEFQITGKGAMSSTYAKLEVSVDGGKSQTWSKLAPISSTSLQPVKWDLKSLREKNQGKDIVARVSLVDGSASELIGVGEAGAIKSLVPSTSTKFSRKFDLEASKVNLYIVRNDPLYGPYTDNSVFSNKYMAGLFGRTNISPADFLLLQDAVWYNVCTNVQFKAFESYVSLGKRIRQEVERTIAERPISENQDFSNSKLHSSLVALGVCAWTFMNCEYDTELSFKNPGFTNSFKSGQPLLDTNLPHPKSICSGIALLTRDLARSAGLKANYVGCLARTPGKGFQSPFNSNHGIVEFDFGEGCISFADTTIGSTLGASRFDRNGNVIGTGRLAKDVLLPMHPGEFEVFFALYRAKDETPIRYLDKQMIEPDEFLATWSLPTTTAHIKKAFEVSRNDDKLNLGY